MMQKMIYFDGARERTLKGDSLLWDESTDAWTYTSGAPKTGTQDAYNAIPTVYRGVGMIAQAVSHMPFAVYRGNNEITNSMEYADPFGYLPNPRWLFGILSQSLDVAGRAYLLPNTNAAGKTKGLQYFKPDSIQPIHDPATGFLIGFERQTQSNPIRYGVDDVIRLWLPDPYVEGTTMDGAIQPPSSWPVFAALRASGVLGNLDDFISF